MDYILQTGKKFQAILEAERLPLTAAGAALSIFITFMFCQGEKKGQHTELFQHLLSAIFEKKEAKIMSFIIALHTRADSTYGAQEDL